VFTCGERVDPWVAVEAIVKQFGATSVTATEIRRGVFSKSVEVAS